MARKTIRSAAFAGVNLRLGGSTVNCQFGAGPYETFEVTSQPDGSVVIESISFPGMFLHLDGRNATGPGAGYGRAFAQRGPDAWGRFRLVAQADGTTGIASLAFPNMFLRMDGREVTRASGPGGGVVNAQAACGPYERFHIVDLYDATEAKGDSSAWFDASFDRSPAVIRIPAHADLAFHKPFTVEAWMMWNGTPGRCVLLSKPAGSGRNEGFALALVNGAPAFELPVDVNRATQWRRLVAGQMVAKSVWTHLAASFDGRVMRLYLNGRLVGQQEGAEGAPPLDVPSPLLIGRQFDGDPDNGFFGLACDARFWNAVVPGSLVRAWSAVDDLSSHPMLSNLMGHWRLDESAGSTFYDSSWRGHDGQGDTTGRSALRRMVYDQDLWASDNRRFILLCDGGLAIDAGAASAGTAVSLQSKAGFTNPAAARQLWRFEGGRITHAASGLALDCSNPESVTLMPRTDGKAAQAWFFDRLTGAVRSPAAPGLVLQTRADTGAGLPQPAIGGALAMAEDKPRSRYDTADFSRRWLFLSVRRREPLVNQSSGRVLVQPDQVAAFDPSNDAHYWYRVREFFINDGTGLPMTCDYEDVSKPGSGTWLNRSGTQPFQFEFEVDRDEPGIFSVAPKITLGRSIELTVDDNLARFAVTGLTPPALPSRRWSLDAAKGWTALRDQFADLAVGVDGFVAVLTREGVPLFSAGDGRWRRLPSPPADLAEISVGSSAALWLRDRSGKVYRFTPAVPTPWDEVPGRRLACVDATAAGGAWGIDIDGRIVRYTGAGWEEVTPAWQQSRGHLHQVSAGTDGVVWGVNPSGEIWNYQPRTRDWRMVPGLLRNVSVGGDGTVCGINSENEVYRYQGTVSGGWQRIGGHMERCGVGNDRVIWALDTTGTLYRYDPAAAQ